VSGQDGMNYAPSGPPEPVCSPGDFMFAAVGLDHGHIYGMCNGLTEAGGQLMWVYDSDPEKVAAFCRAYPGTEPAPSEEAVLNDGRVRMVASAAIPADRAGLGLRVMEHGKHYFADKPPMTTLGQLAEARAKTAETGKKYAVYYSERLHV
jgi:predicted dehydrogenase